MARLPHSNDIFQYPARFQFGQAGAPCRGQSCCTDTCIQMIVEYYKDRTYTLSEIRRRAQAKTSFDERPCTGLNHIETLNALNSMGVTHYRPAFNVTAQQVWEKVRYGPVIVAVYYGSYPNKAGSCRGVQAEIGGRNDCGFRGAHAVLAIGGKFHTIGKSTHRDIFMRDPDHNSPARPYKPDFDRMRLSQLDTAMRHIVPYTAFKSTYILYPTRKKL